MFISKEELEIIDERLNRIESYIRVEEQKK